MNLWKSTMAKHRTWWPSTREEVDALTKAAATDDRAALAKLAVLYAEGSARDSHGTLLVKRNRRRAPELYARAAELGDPAATT